MTRKMARTSAKTLASKGKTSLSRAYRLAQRASRQGFDWRDITDVFKKMDEEVRELREAIALKRRSKIREEVGDLLFVLVNIARFLQIDPEKALDRTVNKFILRFRYVEDALRKKGRSLCQSDLAEMDQLWEEAKKMDKSRIKYQSSKFK